MTEKLVLQQLYSIRKIIYDSHKNSGILEKEIGITLNNYRTYVLDILDETEKEIMTKLI